MQWHFSALCVRNAFLKPWFQSFRIWCNSCCQCSIAKDGSANATHNSNKNCGLLEVVENISGSGFVWGGYEKNMAAFFLEKRLNISIITSLWLLIARVRAGGSSAFAAFNVSLVRCRGNCTYGIGELQVRFQSFEAFPNFQNSILARQKPYLFNTGSQKKGRVWRAHVFSHPPLWMLSYLACDSDPTTLWDPNKLIGNIAFSHCPARTSTFFCRHWWCSSNRRIRLKVPHCQQPM